MNFSGKKIVCLILVHKNVSQVIRLCKSLQHESVEIFIHIDKKMKVSNDEVVTLQTCHHSIHILPERNSCYLDDWSLIKTTMDLIMYAKECLGNQIGYYVLMSGQDYLIKPVTSLVSYLRDNYPKPFIDCTPRANTNWVAEKFAHTKIRIYARILRRVTNIRGFLLLSLYLERLMPSQSIVLNKLQRFNTPLYGGSAWWALPDNVMNDIIDFYIKEKAFINVYKWSDTPEETFFQTVIMQGVYASLVTVNSIEEREQNCLTYANFETKAKKFLGHPHIIEEEDFDWLIKKEQYIARKFDINVDCNIIDKLDLYIHNIK